MPRTKSRPTRSSMAPADARQDIVDQYLADVSRIPLLTRDEELELARKVRRGDTEAFDELVKRNLRFVISVAKKYQNRGMPLIDLIGEGNVGLLTAARKFDPDQGVKFISYAVWWVRQAILSALARQGRSLRVPLNRTADLSRMLKSTEMLRQTLHREPTADEIGRVAGLSASAVESLTALTASHVSLDAPLGPDGDRSYMERFEADSAPDAEDDMSGTLIREELELALGALPPRDAKVIRLYFGLDGDREHTLEEIGTMLGITRERVRQLRDRGLKQLRESESAIALSGSAA